MVECPKCKNNPTFEIHDHSVSEDEAGCTYSVRSGCHKSDLEEVEEGRTYPHICVLSHGTRTSRGTRTSHGRRTFRWIMTSRWAGASNGTRTYRTKCSRVIKTCYVLRQTNSATMCYGRRMHGMNSIYYRVPL